MRRIRIEIHFAYWYLRLFRTDFLAWAANVDTWSNLRKDTLSKMKKSKDELLTH